ncbi:hypothetical protein [Mangrovimonas spongiae]|uniref:DUF4738 domain-containing protein n=1 Tax=Mangrovimonas spongiae TaxID=2494697 RepID=A0A3R9PHT7_9FLAO|nr:hypothetical protein [Mangrovimonas spongiae]RSK38535.1 hypothetical protein EJA19_10760 [Mangrovimonas spongiae]
MKSTITFFIALIVAICFFNCDGRHRAQKSYTENLIKENLPSSFSEQVTFYPENYAEHVNDTTLTNGYRAHIKSYSDMVNHVVITEKKNKTILKTHYRKAIGEITVYKDNSEVFMTVINDQLFSKHIDNLPKDFNQYILKSLWVNQYKSLKNNQLIVDVLLQKPKSKHQINCQLIIDSKGKFNIIKNV